MTESTTTPWTGMKSSRAATLTTRDRPGCPLYQVRQLLTVNADDIMRIPAEPREDQLFVNDGPCCVYSQPSIDSSRHLDRATERSLPTPTGPLDRFLALEPPLTPTRAMTHIQDCYNGPVRLRALDRKLAKQSPQSGTSGVMLNKRKSLFQQISRNVGFEVTNP